MTCLRITNKGEQCRRRPVGKSKYCNQHKKKTASKKKQTGGGGGYVIYQGRKGTRETTAFVLRIIKPLVRSGDLASLQDFFYERNLLENPLLDFEKIFNRVFTDSCHYGHFNMLEWVSGFYRLFDIDSRKKLAGTLSYCLVNARYREDEEIVDLVEKIRKDLTNNKK